MKTALLVLVLFGAAMFITIAIFTPAISSELMNDCHAFLCSFYALLC
jgi:hypothetical protein